MSTRPPAPLAQLRDVDPLAWRVLCAQSSAPGVNPITQALAAALLGDLDLARDVLASGPGAVYLREWPELRPEGVR